MSRDGWPGSSRRTRIVYGLRDVGGPLVLLFAGGLVLIRWLSLTSPIELAYILHVWMLLIVGSWLVIFHRRFPVGSFSWSCLRGWRKPWCVVGGLYLVLTLLSPGPPLQHRLWAWILFQGVFVGLTEEFFFRGLIQTTLHALMGFTQHPSPLPWGTVIAALIFGLSHLIHSAPQSWVLTWGSVLFATVMGLILGHYYDRTRNLWGAVVLHNLIDSLSVIVPWVLGH